MTLVQLKLFIAVIDFGSFSDAAHQIGVTQSAVSHAISKLETKLGVVLLERKSGRVKPTIIGEKISIQARMMLQSQAVIEQEAAVGRGVDKGILRIGSFGTTSSIHFLPQMVGQFSQEFPDATLEVFEASDQEIVQWLQTRRVEIGFVVPPIVGFDLVELGEDELVVVLPADHSLTKHQQVPISDLTSESFIMSRAGCEPLVRALFRRHDIQPKINHYIQQTASILHMVKIGLGISIVAAGSLPSNVEEIEIRPLDPSAPRPIAIAFQDLRHLSPLAQSFVEMASFMAESNA